MPLRVAIKCRVLESLSWRDCQIIQNVDCRYLGTYYFLFVLFDRYTFYMKIRLNIGKLSSDICTYSADPSLPI